MLTIIRLIAVVLLAAMALFLYGGMELIDASYTQPDARTGLVVAGFLLYAIGCGCGFSSLALWTRADR
jgi:uncharacterized membrane protein